jgi:hypothetical protein
LEGNIKGKLESGDTDKTIQRRYSCLAVVSV